MKTKRIIALILAFCMLVIAFVSCSKKEDIDGENANTTTVENGSENTETPPSDEQEKEEQVKKLPIDLSLYEIIYSAESPFEITTACNQLSDMITTIIGQAKKPKLDSKVEANNASYEILIGNTNREQSKTAKQSMTKNTYSITCDGNKIVIVAEDVLVLEDAIDYFMGYIKKFYGGKGELPETYSSEPYEVLPLTTNGKANYNIVFTDFYNNINKHSDGTGYDSGFTIEKVREFKKNIDKMTGSNFSYYPENQMSDAKHEIIIGKINGETNHYFDYYQSGVHLKDGDIYIYGHNHEGIEAAINAFFSRISTYTYRSGSDDYSLFCENTGYKKSNYDLEYTIPLPKGLKFEGAYSAPENRVYFVYENCTKNTFDEYIALLGEQGFNQYFYREAGTLSKNYFAGYNKGVDAAWVYYIHDRAEMRVVFEKYQPIPNIVSRGKVTEPTFLQFGFEYQANSTSSVGAAGMSFIVTLEDGSYAIVDGGGSGDAANKETAAELYDYLVKNNKRTDGKIVISAWFITHSHGDHTNVFKKFGELYGNKVTAKYLIYNQPTKLSTYGAANGSGGFTSTMDQIAKTFVGSTVYLVHTGCAFDLGGVFVEFMSTYEDLYNHNKAKHEKDPYMPNAVDEMNDTCITFRFYFNKGKADEATVFILGDCYFEHGERLASMWDLSYMRSTIVQAAHHGYINGVTSGVVDPNNVRSTTYAEIRAEYCLWPQGYYHWSRGTKMRELFTKANPRVKFYCNSDADGTAVNHKFTFNGGVKVTTERR